MKCEICNKNKASTVVYRNGKELFVCKSCAASNSKPNRPNNKIDEDLNLPENFKGKIHIHGDKPPPEVMDAIVKATMKFVEGFSQIAEESKEKKESKKKCPGCGTSWDDINNTSFFTCPTCYKTFASLIRKEMLAPMYGKRHVGRSHSSCDVKQTIESLKRKLKVAVKKEEYEIASKLQKEIDELTRKSTGEK